MTNFLWIEAFSKFGFGDGDDVIQTDQVADYLAALGHSVSVVKGGCHNEYIDILTSPRTGADMIADHRPGYTNPRQYLPDETIAALNERFGHCDPLLDVFGE